MWRTIGLWIARALGREILELAAARYAAKQTPPTREAQLLQPVPPGTVDRTD